MEVVLLGIHICLSLFWYFKIDRSFVSPCFLFFIGNIFSNIMFIYGNISWDIFFSFECFNLCLLGTFVFLLVSLISTLIAKSKKTVDVFIQHINDLEYNNEIMKCFTILQIVVVFAFVLYFKEYILAFDLGNLRYHIKDNLITIPFWLGQLMKVSWVVATIQVLFIARNICSGKIGFYKLEVIGVITFIVLQMLTSARAYILYLFIEFCVVYLYMLHFNGLSIKKGIKKILFFSLIFLSFFYIAGTLIGRGADKHNFLYYIAMYSGSPIAIFSNYINEEIIKVSFDGNNTISSFQGFNSILSFFDIRIQAPSFDGEFLYIDGVAIGNACHPYFYWLFDFGIIGIISCTFVEALIFNYLYFKCTHSYKKNSTFVWLLLYSSIAYALVLHCIADYFFRFIFSINQLSYFMILWAINKVLFRNIKILF